MSDTAVALRAPFPWFGGKSLAAPAIWEALGNVPNYVEPFAGSLATLLARPTSPHCETVNDADGFVCNFWRAVAHAPEQVAKLVDWPVNELDLHARHAWLVPLAAGLDERLRSDPEYYDVKIAAWWCWGLCAWIGNGWCSRDERLHQTIPKLSTPGQGIHAPSRKKPATHRGKGVHASSNTDLVSLFTGLCARMRNVRVCCGDWQRVMGKSTLGLDTRHGMSPCGIVLDPPYDHDLRDKRLYRVDDPGISAAVREWAIANGDNPQLRIVLCGLDGEHDMPASWRCVPGASRGASSEKERLWLSPHCLNSRQGSLFVTAQRGLLGKEAG